VPVTDELRLLATRVVWWEAPAEVLANETDVLCRVMAREPVAVVSARPDR
jgi:hypothetical protein